MLTKVGMAIIFSDCQLQDTWDSSEMFVDAYMRVRKTVPLDSPLHWKYDRDKKQFIV